MSTLQANAESPRLSDFYHYQRIAKSNAARDELRRTKGNVKREIRSINEPDEYSVVRNALGGFTAKVQHGPKTIVATADDALTALANLREKLFQGGDAGEAKTLSAIVRRGYGTACGVEEFHAKPDLGELYRYRVDFSTDRQMTRGDFERAIGLGFGRWKEPSNDRGLEALA